MPVGRRLVRTLLFSFVLLAAPLRADSVWTIPGIVNASGLNGTHFVSDLTVTNSGSAPANVTLSFFPSGSGAKTLALAPGQTVVSSDVVASLFSSPGAAGALSVSSDQPLLIRAKTYNTSASGTYGVALPVVASDRLLAPGDVRDSLWITQDASGAAGYRTNIAMVFPDDSGGEATVTVYDADGNEVGSQDYSLDAPGLQQFAVGSFAGAVPVGRAQVQVIRGSAAGYSVVVDNVTGDSSLFAFEQLPAGWQDVLVNGVARANGRNGTFFRTDGRFYNPASEDATVTVAFHSNQNVNSSPVTKDFTIPAGKILDVVDLLDSLLGLPVGSSGALRFHAEWPVAIFCRTSNVDPTGSRPGTFGAQQRPVPLLSFVNSADAGAAITGIRQNAAFRTNVGFAAGADGASYTLALADASGATVATTSASLGVFGWNQPNVQDLFPTTTIPDNATLTVRVTAGSVDVFDSSIDNLSGDPVVSPITPLPASIPSSATIGPQGGSIRSDDGALTLEIPAGALGAPTPMSIAITSNDAPGALGSAYDVSPGGLALAKPALLSLRYGVAGLPVDGIDAVSLAVLGDTGWGGLTGGRVDTTSRSLLVPLLNTTPSAALAGTRTTQARAGSKPTHIAPLLAFGALDQYWLPTGGKMQLSGKMILPPTDAGTEYTVVPITRSNTVAWSDPSLGSISPKNSATATYTAPASIQWAFRVVTLKVMVIDSGKKYEARAYFKVIRRHWRLEVVFDVNMPCAGRLFSLSYTDTAVQTFSLNDDLGFAADPPLVSVRKSFAFAGICDPNCKATMTTPPAALGLINMAATFLLDNGFAVLGTVFQKNATPPISIVCPFSSDNDDGLDYSVPVPGVYWPLSNETQFSLAAPPGATQWPRAKWESIP
jgi:hypothetical protein